MKIFMALFASAAQRPAHDSSPDIDGSDGLLFFGAGPEKGEACGLCGTFSEVEGLQP